MVAAAVASGGMVIVSLLFFRFAPLLARPNRGDSTRAAL
jgi:hypothetical protein